MKHLFTLLIVAVLPAIATAQSVTIPADLYEEAEYYRMNEDYTEALPLYQRLLGMGYNHEQMHYLIGRTSLNINGQESRALHHLRKARVNLGENVHLGGGLDKPKAPKDALFYLGKAFQVHNKLDSALTYYNLFLESIKNKKAYNLAFVDRQIASARTAKKLLNNPVDITRENIGPPVNDAFPNSRPVVNEAETRMVYTSELKFYDAVFMAEKDSSGWGEPFNLAPQIRSEGSLYPCDMNAAGDKLVLFRKERSRGDLYISKYDSTQGEWQEPQEPEGDINSRFWETHGCIGPGGNTLYFTSNRRGGYGRLDIYVSYYNYRKGEWGEPRNLGDSINTRFNEATPFISSDGQYLFFSSQGHEGMGGFDIFRSKKKADGSWSEPVNLGYPINTTNDDRFFHPVKNGKAGYISRFNREGGGGQDIFRLSIPSDTPKSTDR